MARCDDDGRHNGNSTVMGINGRSNVDLKAVDGLPAMDGSSMVMDGAVRRQWTAQRLIDSDGWRDGSLMAMYSKGHH